MLKNKKKGETEEVGWPKVARVEYWNALPEAISVRCPPFALLSCPLQASSSFPSTSLSLYLLLFSLSCRFASRLFLPPSLSLLRVPFAKLRSIFHLEFRRSLAINPRIHYGLRGPYCSFFATSARCLPVPASLPCLPACLPTCLPACLSCLLACLRRSSASLRFAGPPRRSRRVVFRVCDVIPGHWSDAGFREYRQIGRAHV